MQINESVHAALTDADKQELEIWEELLDSRGFAQLTQMLQEQMQSIQVGIEDAPNWDSYVYRRGQRDAYNVVLNLEALLEAKVESIAESLEEERQESLDQEHDEISVNLGLEE